MKNQEMVKYNGRVVPKEGFRAYVFGTDGTRKLVNSYDEYEDHVQTGVWFPSLNIANEKKKSKKGG